MPNIYYIVNGANMIIIFKILFIITALVFTNTYVRHESVHLLESEIYENMRNKIFLLTLVCNVCLIGGVFIGWIIGL